MPVKLDSMQNFHALETFKRWGILSCTQYGNVIVVSEVISTNSPHQYITEIED